ncbi:MAG TPA: hypothetical protein VGR32_10710 [Brevundimonas sp.]|jgi:hypothetical protein|uniref:hypothetical protein n=1 Tax=Brevundimonas sp. TaxID=1871086 RepID=UPI002DE99070|nr:hypothetical protein [Brevundimonas sp.]
MIKIAAAFAALALVAGAAPAALAQTSPPATQDAKPNIGWTIGELLENEKSAAVLEKHMPGIADHPARPQFEGMTLHAVMPYSDGAITEELIDAIDADLKALPAD